MRMALTAMAMLAVGCAPPPDPEAVTANAGPVGLAPVGNGAPAAADSARDGKDDRYVLLVRLQLVSIEVPVGTVSGSEEIWSYLDEESIRQIRTPAIGLNGLRIGRGRADSWPDLARILQRMTGRRLHESSMLALPGRPVPIVLKKAQPAQTIFIFNGDGTLHGSDFPPGDNMLTIYCSLDQDDPSKVLLTAMPQIRSSRQKTKFVDSAGGLAMVNRPTVYNLPAMMFQLTVPNNDFLIIGPGAHSARPSSVGHRFLVKLKDGMEFETVLVIKVQVFAASADNSHTSPLPK